MPIWMMSRTQNNPRIIRTNVDNVQNTSGAHEVCIDHTEIDPGTSSCLGRTLHNVTLISITTSVTRVKKESPVEISVIPLNAQVIATTQQLCEDASKYLPSSNRHPIEQPDTTHCADRSSATEIFHVLLHCSSLHHDTSRVPMAIF